MGLEDDNNNRPHKDRVQDALRADAFKKINKIHEVLIGDEYGNKGLIEKVGDNTQFREKRQEERRMVHKASKIVGTAAATSGVLWGVWDKVKHLFGL